MRKTMLAATALAALAFIAVPALASATPFVTNFTNNNRHFTVAGGAIETKAGLTVKCKEVTGTCAMNATRERNTITDPREERCALEAALYRRWR